MKTLYAVGGLMTGYSLAFLPTTDKHPGWGVMLLIGVAMIVAAAFREQEA